MPGKLELPEATSIINQIQTLDEKLKVLIENYQNKSAQYESNIREISRIEGLKKTNEILKNDMVKLKSDINEVESQINDYKKKVEDSGWVVPLPKREIKASSMRL